MDVNNCFERLRKLTTKIAIECPNINRGGCGFFALFLSKKLEELQIDYEWVYIRDTAWESEDILTEINNVNSGKKGQCSSAHIMLKIGNYYIDGRGLHTAPNMFNEWLACRGYRKEISLKIPYELMVKPINNARWNTMYDADHYNEKVVHCIEEYMSNSN